MKSIRERFIIRIIHEPEHRQPEYHTATIIETVFSLLAAALAILAVWGFTADTAAGGIHSHTIGGLAILCFCSCMAIAAGSGIKKKFITLVCELEPRTK